MTGDNLRFVHYEHTSDTKRKPLGRPPHDLDYSNILKCMHLSQQEASDKLGISLSTLKRRFYEFGVGRWPSKSERIARENNPMSIQAIINKEFFDEKDITTFRGSKIPWLASLSK
ncbi:hypothetical protein AKO1_012048 [Acrasis kona]|uniref:RWP-RK domain-containing protein n=1 Tax=Acrasis kona TaxID=1008807 RepID=A0AAW2ZB11_9EUKA